MANDLKTEPLETLKEPLKTWGRFRLDSLLGKGGMGEVYKAYDPDLKRHIALKILRYENLETLKRFLREARSQAQVEHPHVCKIYESGESDGHPYIAMQYIEGKNLHQLREQLTLEEKIRIIKDVALGLHAAHRLGLVHRDVKPANIMVSQTEEGQWKSYILDFGAAREQEALGLTSTGMIIGTPFYMAPEHARGRRESLDRRSDVYSLGVTLYELLSGHVPFKGDTPMDILFQVIEKDPIPLRRVNPRIPVDIETIVMKCLEKDPSRRYASGKELAEDLQHYMDGEPITARPATLIYRLKRKVVKHKLPFILGATAAVVILILLGLWLQTRYHASQRAVIARELSREVEKIESTIRYAHLLPLHNISREKEQIKERIRLIEDNMKTLGRAGRGPSYYAMGRGHLALQDYDRARLYLEKAWAYRYRIPSVAYDLGRVMGELYLRESQKANSIENKAMREARIEEVEKNFREPAVRFLKYGKLLEDESEAYIDAIVAFYEKRYDHALTVLQSAIWKARQETPWLYEACTLEGNIHLAIARDSKGFDEAMISLTAAENAFQYVARIGESDTRGYDGLGRVLDQRIRLEAYSRGNDPLPMVKDAVAFYEKALQIEPRRTEFIVKQGSVYRWLGRHLMIAGKDPIPAFDQAIAYCRDAISIDPKNFEGYTIMGIVTRYQGQYRMNRGQDPEEQFNSAIDYFNKAIKLNPSFVTAYNGLGNVHVRFAQYKMQQGKGPHGDLEKAAENFEKALSINPDIIELHNGLAGALLYRGRVMMAGGIDPRDALNGAIASMRNAIKLSPGVVHLHTNLGFIYMDIARYEIEYGFDPLPTVDNAVKSFEKAIDINPKSNELYQGLVTVTAIQASYDYMSGNDCSKWLAHAGDYFKRGLEANQNDAMLYLYMGANLLIQARYLVDRDRDPMELLGRADRWLTRARRINQRYYETYVQQALSSIIKARWNVKGKRDPLYHFQQALASLTRAEQLNPSDINLHLMRARVQWRVAQWKITRRFVFRPNIDAGLNAVEKALSINNTSAEAFALKGVLLKLLADTTASDVERRTAREVSISSLKQALKINRNLDALFRQFL